MKTIYRTKTEIVVAGIVMALLWIVFVGMLKETWAEIELLSYGFKLDAALSFEWLCGYMLREVWSGIAFGVCTMVYMVLNPTYTEE